MATLVENFDFTFSAPCDPSTPPFAFDTSLLDIPFHPGHVRSSSHDSVYSMVSTVESSPDTMSTRMTTPNRSSPPIRSHGPLLLPKIRSQDQEIVSPPKRVKTSPAPAVARTTFRPSHSRSFTNPEPVNFKLSFSPPPEELSTASLLCSPVTFAQDLVLQHPHAVSAAHSHSRRASSCNLDDVAVEKYGFPTYRQMPAYVPAPSAPQVSVAAASENFMYPSYAPRAPSPLSLSATPEPVQTTTLMSYLTAPNPAAALVRTINFPHRDPHAKNFWWDVRQVRPWTDFNAASILSLPGAAALLNTPVPAPVLPVPAFPSRHPETEAALHAIYAGYYLPKLNAALAISSHRPIAVSVPPRPAAAAAGGASDLLFVATGAGESAAAAAMFGGKPSARAVGLVRSFDRFNTGMRVEGNVKRVEYLRGLAALHHAMREHGCRYGFILTEIELVVARNGADRTPHFGFLEVATIQLAAQGQDAEAAGPALTPCLALWGLCALAADDAYPGTAHWRSEIGAPAEGTRRKALPRDSWMPQPQLAEKREAKRSRGWVFPEDPVGRKELGKRGVRYNGL